MQMLGVATRFARMAHSTETRSRYVIVARFSGVLIGMSVYCLCGSNCVPHWILIMARFSGLLIGMSVYCLCGSDCVPQWILIMARFSGLLIGVSPVCVAVTVFLIGYLS